MPRTGWKDTAAMTLAAVVIGRNEGDRLVRCLTSLKGQAAPVVYVDSGSTDGSVERARDMGAEVVSLDMSQDRLYYFDGDGNRVA